MAVSPFTSNLYLKLLLGGKKRGGETVRWSEMADAVKPFYRKVPAFLLK